VNFRTKSYLRKRFGDYYQNSELPMPYDFKRREWGFIFFDELPEVVMRRHRAFSSEGEAAEYLRGMVPAHVYHSAAYYQFPGAGTMKEKKWEGADLIFDLDADHLPQKATSYAEMLANVKSETGKLLDFLLEDFGFGEETIRVAFSGGRGYHIHVHDPRVLTLESAQRREIVDYIGGMGINVDFMFREYIIGGESKTYGVRREGGFGFEQNRFDASLQFKTYVLKGSKGTSQKRTITVGLGTKRIISFIDTPGGFGWGKRVSKHLVSYLGDLLSKEEHMALGEISYAIYAYNNPSPNINNSAKEIAGRIFQFKNEHPSWSSKRIYQEIAENTISESFVHDILHSGNKAKKIINIAKSEEAIKLIKDKGIIDFGGVPEFFEIILQHTVEEFGIKLGAKTDEPVTADIRRLIRMPSSLHGGSGMRVVPLTLAEFDQFEPLRDAVVFSEKEIKIEVFPPLKPQNSLVEMKGKSIKVEEGINTVPEYAGIYLMCRGAAEYA